MPNDFIIDVNESDFEYEVINYSQTVPVVVDFWADWCRPCKTLSPLLERLAVEAKGSFRLAKVDVDENPNLALRYSVRSLPTIKIFRESQLVAELVGLQPEARIREVLGKITPPSPHLLLLEKAQSYLELQDWHSAETAFREFLQVEEEHPAGTLGLVKSLLAQGNEREAAHLIRFFPASKQYATVEVLRPYADALAAYRGNRLSDDTDLDAAFSNSIRLASRGNFEAALDGLLDILRQDKHYRDDSARKTALAMLEILGDTDPQTRPYRVELASILF